uniref:hypothetical protein n=1 Tax=Enterocloster clostridioformis TaxID=1531 RepID=UPI0025A5ECFA
NWNPVFTSGFEADLSAIERKKPFFQRIKIGIEGGEPLFNIRSNTPVVCQSNGSDNKFLVNVHATADKVFDR